MNVEATVLAWYLVLLSPPLVPANHYQWWTCSSECRRCIRITTPLENWISEYYSGLFSREPPVQFYDTMQINSDGNPTGPSNPGNPGRSGTTGNPHSNGNPGNPGRPEIYPNPHHYGCCETEFGHWTPNDTEFEGKKYAVVHLKQQYQFIQVGRCRLGTTCQQGTCVQMYRAHWILVYNNTKPLTSAPVSFAPKKIPSHCECLNIGRARP